jgi:gluconate 2-dehydrogenase gamma chain
VHLQRKAFERTRIVCKILLKGKYSYKIKRPGSFRAFFVYPKKFNFKVAIQFLPGTMLNRRYFIKISALSAAIASISLKACRKELPDSFAMRASQKKTLYAVHEHLFPYEKNRPGAKNINSVPYIEKVLLDPQVKKEDKSLLLFGINWTEDTSMELFNKRFIELDSTQKESVLLDLRGYTNGERWLSKNITYILEALLADPVYGVNTDGAGWSWLKHQTGFPRPDIRTKYQYL